MDETWLKLSTALSHNKHNNVLWIGLGMTIGLILLATLIECFQNKSKDPIDLFLRPTFHCSCLECDFCLNKSDSNGDDIESQ